MRGRKKNRAEKYDPEMELSELSERAWKGRFAGELIWEHVLEFLEVSEPDWDKIDEVEFYEKYPEASPRRMILEWCGILLDTKNADGFLRLGEMMKVATDLKNKGEESVDPQRCAILGGNHILFRRIYEKTKYAGDVKKGELLSFLRKEHAKLFEQLEDSDAYRMIRSMGLPRRPYVFTEASDRAMASFLRGVKKRWKKK